VKRERVDKLLVERGHAGSRERARALIMAGVVRVQGRIVDKPGTMVQPDTEIGVEALDLPFVSRGGLKLDAALDHFSVAVEDAIVLDVGASTGGFTDCVLRRGARAVIAVDVGYGQFAWKLRQDSRVTLIERRNIRYLKREELPLLPALAVVDVSFISLKVVLPVVAALVAVPADIIVLVKPQFEVGRGQVGKGGVVRDPLQREAAVASIRACGEGLGLECAGEFESPVPGPKGNREVFLHFTRGHQFAA
jgi:23S rRNA (cytidine1920-2'-O)/16S rRNA (cytidine1409-2'-O)-methyltransferase